MKVEVLGQKEIKPIGHMQIGEVGEIVGGKSYLGHIVVAGYQTVVDLNNPLNTWTLGSDWGLTVRILPSGTKLQLEVE